MSSSEQQFAVLRPGLSQQSGGVDHSFVPDLFSPFKCKEGHTLRPQTLCTGRRSSKRLSGSLSPHVTAHAGRQITDSGLASTLPPVDPNPGSNPPHRTGVTDDRHKRPQIPNSISSCFISSPASLMNHFVLPSLRTLPKMPTHHGY